MSLTTAQRSCDMPSVSLSMLVVGALLTGVVATATAVDVPVHAVVAVLEPPDAALSNGESRPDATVWEAKGTVLGKESLASHMCCVDGYVVAWDGCAWHSVRK